MSLQNYSIAQTAEILCCYVGFLEENLADLPHQKIGKAVAFDDEEIAQIKEMFRVRPAAPSARAASAPPAGAPSITQIRPKGARRTG
ncbi:MULTISPECIES: hypothetical protein [Streptomyces]|uniref:Uncharacterized protein n=1 Tax=Streptomyces erythrochromogenes TaxID=285574 RepID=A0ABZ1QEN7_9ACTN|nr:MULTISPECIES: hypothetical protein [Streptomyces]